MNPIESFTHFLEAQAFAGFMLGWIFALVGGAMHLIGGGFRDGDSKVPVLGNWQSLQPGEKGFLQQIIGGWVLKMGFLMVLVCGFIHFL